MFERIEVGSPSRPWATAFAFLLNATLLTLAVLLPMVRPDRLPNFNVRVVTPPYSVPAEEAVTDTHTATRQANSAATLPDSAFRAPGRIPDRIDMSRDNARPYGPISTIIGTGNYNPNLPTGLPFATSTNPPPIPVVANPPTPKTVVVSHLDEGMLIRKVQPVYPPIAKATRTQGSVVLAALINTRGEIDSLEVISGSPLLVQAAVAAVRQWRYRPYILNGTPIAVQTHITVNFSLQ